MKLEKALDMLVGVANTEAWEGNPPDPFALLNILTLAVVALKAEKCRCLPTKGGICFRCQTLIAFAEL